MNTFALRLWPRFARVAHRPHFIVLQPRELWSARLNAGEHVGCERGILWLTQSDDAQDYILRAGERFTASRRGRVVAQAMEETTLCIEAKPSGGEKR